MRICAYRGYATSSEAFVAGRVLANKAPGELGDKQSLWRNLIDTYCLFETEEVRTRLSPFDFKERSKPPPFLRLAKRSAKGR